MKNETKAETAPAQADVIDNNLKSVPCNLAVPTFDAAGKVVGAHNLPVHLLTVDGRTNTGYGIAWVFAGKAEAETLASRYNSHTDLLAALEACLSEPGCLGMTNPRKYGPCRLEAINEIARAAIARAKEGK